MKLTLIYWVAALSGSIAFTIYVVPRIICDMWLWFVVPLGVRELTHWQAFGLVMFYGLFLTASGVRRSFEEAKKRDEKKATWSMVKSELANSANMAVSIMLAQLIAWGIASVVHGWM